MKRVLLVLFLVLSLLVSCASSTKGNDSQTISEQQQTQTTAVETPVPEEDKLSAETEIVVPQEEPAAETEPETEEQPVAEQVIAEEVTPVAEIPEESASVSDELDWSQVISAAPDAAAEETAAEGEQAAPQMEQTVEVAPAQEKKAETPAPEPVKAQSQPTAAAKRPSSFVDNLTSLIKKVGNFVADQILLSVGIFVCIGGMIYLIAALVISGRRDREKARSGRRNAKSRDEDSESFRPSSDSDPETDEDFLKRLLGDGNE